MRHLAATVVVVVVLLGLSSLRADPPAELKTALGALVGRDLVKARVSYEYWHGSGDEKKPVEETAKIVAQAEAGPAGLRVSWPRELIEAAADEQRIRAENPDRKTPTRQAMEELGAETLSNYLNAAPEMLRMLGRAQFLEEKSEPWQGRPARALAFKLTLPMSAQDRKYIKELDATAKIWIGADGLPVGAERRIHIKGRALLVISFESDEREEFQFSRIGDRLVILQHAKESSGSGAGERGRQKTTAILTLLGGETEL